MAKGFEVTIWVPEDSCPTSPKLLHPDDERMTQVPDLTKLRNLVEECLDNTYSASCIEKAEVLTIRKAQR